MVGVIEIWQHRAASDGNNVQHDELPTSVRWCTSPETKSSSGQFLCSTRKGNSTWCLMFAAGETPEQERQLLRASISPTSEPCSKDLQQGPTTNSYVLPGTTLNRTYGTHQKPIRFAIFTNHIWSYLLRSPVNSRCPSGPLVFVTCLPHPMRCLSERIDIFEAYGVRNTGRRHFPMNMIQSN